MKNKFLLSMMMLCFAFFGVARADVVEIGDPASTFTQYYIPFNTFYSYSLTQQIFTACEIGTAGTINSIAFDFAYDGSFTMSDVQIYMKLTDKSKFESNTDMVSLDDATLVWEGDFAPNGAGWVELTLTTPFEVDGTSNLLVCTYDPSSGYLSTSYKFRCTTTGTAYRCLTYYHDSYCPNLEDLTAYNGNKVLNQYRNNIQLGIIPDPSVEICCPPTNVAVTETMPHGFSATFTPGNESQESWYYYWSTGNETPDDVYYGTTLTTDFTLDYHASLNAETTYYLWIGVDCSDGAIHWSEPVTFTTDVACPAPTGLAVADNSITANGATLNWTGTSDSYILMVAEANIAVDADFETGDLSQADFTTTTSYPWTVVANTHSGAYCAKSGNVDVNSSTSDMVLEVTLATDMTLTFSAKVSSESNYDKAYFTIDGTQNISGISGAGNWIDYSYPLAAGTHTLRWYFQKDYSVGSNDDCFYVDDIHIESDVISWTEYTTAAQTYTFDDLKSSTTYKVKVQGNCGDEGYSIETDPVSFTTLPLTKAISGYGEGNGNWYFIASPVGTVDVTSVDQLLDNDFDLYYFEQTVTDNNEWINYEQGGDTPGFTQLVSGKGYLYANSADVTLTFTGTPITDASVVVPLAYDADARLGGWNLIGNPYATDATVNIENFYVMDGNDDFVSAETNVVGAMAGILVEAQGAGESVTFSKGAGGQDPGGGEWKLNLRVSDGNHHGDVARIRFGEGRGLRKLMLNPSHTSLYIPMDDADYAVAHAANMGEMPVNFKAEENGTYTLSFTAENVDFNYLHLIDNKTGEDVDLLQTPSYSFDALTTDYASRFKLVFATGNGDGDSFAFYSNGSFIVSNEGEAVLQVVDVTGRILKSETISGSASVNVSAAPGVYMLRLVNGESMKVQKVVVR